MNAELLQAALEKAGNINTLINVVSRRVRQLSANGGGITRPMVADTANLGMADIALREIIEGKIGWDMPTADEWSAPVKRKRSRKAGAKVPRSPMLPAISAVAA